MERIELLAPAGDYNCFLAAINAGADAVYLSGDKFGARAYAKNFSTEELIKAIDYAHIFNRKVFLTVNTLLKDDELSMLYDFLLPFYKAGLDGVIVQDMGVISYIRRTFSDMPVHASTQLTITSLEGIRLLEKLGVKRTVLAREVSMDEIEYIQNNSDMEIETFVHGALCYSYSGKCLFSSLVGGRSGNRGRCAGSCRQPYNNNQYLLSTKDICCLSIIPEMISAGICSLKIEGRMKSPEYVAGVTSIYRKYIDFYYENINRMSVLDIKNRYFKGALFNKDRDTLTRLYTRGGNSQGYYYRHNGRDMISMSDASYKSDKGEIKDSIGKDYLENSEKMKISAFVRIYPDENISILINNEFYYEGVMALSANNRPIDKDTVRKQLNKTKDTEFEFDEIDFDIADNAFVRISDLNELRRNSLDLFRENLLTSYRREEPVKSHEIINKINKNISIEHNRIINCEILTLDQLNVALLSDRINGVYVPFELLTDKSVINKIKDSNKKIYVKFPSVIRHNYLCKNKNNIMDVLNNIDGVLADSHEVIDFIREEGFLGQIIGDIHIYSFNNEADKAYRDLSVDKLTVPVELNKKELYKRDLSSYELIAYGYLPMMISAQCVNNTLNGCNKSQELINLKDRRGAEFKVLNMCSSCLNVVYNNVPLSLHGDIDFIDRINPASIRLVFSVESEDETERVINYFTKYLDGETDSKFRLFEDNCYTKGHLNRGVL